jgi:antitoxin HicB
MFMKNYIALIHKDDNSCYGASFPDVPGVFTAADTLDDVIERASEVLSFAAEDWEELTGRAFPEPRSLDELRQNKQFLSETTNAIVAAIPFQMENLVPA